MALIKKFKIEKFNGDETIVEIKDDNSVMKAQVVRLNILTKDIEINSQDKIKIITN